MLRETHLECEMLLYLKDNTKTYFSRKFDAVIQTLTIILQNLDKLVTSNSRQKTCLLIKNSYYIWENLKEIARESRMGESTNDPLPVEKLSLAQTYVDKGLGSSFMIEVGCLSQNLFPFLVLTVSFIHSFIFCHTNSCSKPHLHVKPRVLGPVVQSPISTDPGSTLNKTYRVNPGLALIGL